jgi:HK97 family phage major capsid protein
MRNPDMQSANMDTLRTNFQAAMAGGDEAQVTEALFALGESIQANILSDARMYATEAASDSTALAARGIHQLTAEERKYYNAIIENATSGNPTSGHAFTDAEQLPPPTVITRVFEDLKKSRPLLGLIRTRHATATTEFLERAGDVPGAFWGALNKAAQELLFEGFVKIKMGMNILSCYVPIHRDMLKLGPEWLDRFIREVLVESMAISFEMGIVDGTGVDMPIGITRDVDDPAHPRKDATTITDLQPVTLGTVIMAPLTRGGKRSAEGAILIVNPLDYWEKIFGATTYMNAQGQYVQNILPIPAQFVQSSAMPVGYMAAGMARDYFLGVAFDRGIEHSDEVRFLEDQRVYKTRLAANGKPLDNKSFLLFDITGLQPSLRLNVDTGEGSTPDNGITIAGADITTMQKEIATLKEELDGAVKAADAVKLELEQTVKAAEAAAKKAAK